MRTIAGSQISEDARLAALGHLHKAQNAAVRAEALGLGAVVVILDNDKDAQLGPLDEALRDADAEVRRIAQQKLEKVGTALPSFVEPLAADLDVPNNRDTAMAVLALCGDDSVPTLIELLESKDPAVHGAALEVLARIGWSDSELVPSLLRLLRSKDAALRARAMRSLGALGPRAEPAVAGLIRQVRNREDRALAVETLGLIGESAAGAVKRLAALLRDRDAGIRGQAATALGQIGLPAGQRFLTLGR